MNLAEQLKREQRELTENDWRAERFLDYIAKQFKSGKREVALRFFGLREDFSDVECPIPDEWRHVSGGQLRKIVREGERYVGVKSGVSWVRKGYVSKCDLTESEYPYRGFTDDEDRDAKIRILENAGFKTRTQWVYGYGDVTTVSL